MSIDYKKLNKYIVELTQYLTKTLNLDTKNLPKVVYIKNDIENANNILGETAYYAPENKKIVLYTYKRHPKDILRSFSHEMIHHYQNENNKLPEITTYNINEDDELLKIEQEAYTKGNLLFRSWENKKKK